MLKVPNSVRGTTTRVECDRTAITNALDDECLLFVSLANRLLEPGESLDELLKEGAEIRQYWWGEDTGAPIRLRLQLRPKHENWDAQPSVPTWISFMPFAPTVTLTTQRESSPFSVSSGSGTEIRSLDRLRLRNPLNMQPSSTRTYQLARSWVDDCIKSHAHAEDTTRFQPTRLVHIHKENTSYVVRLIESSNSRNDDESRYVALSYCWGGDQPQKMTRSKYAKTHGVICFDDMPATIQDAITVTFEMGFAFLWVDSLCIMQDDVKDLSHEISWLTEVYSHAAVTIAASTARSVGDGFIDRRAAVDCIFPDISALDNNGHRYTFSLLQTWMNEDVTLPLDTRAWTFQEELLSTRILQFRHYQMQLICSSHAPALNAWTDGFQKPTFLLDSEVMVLTEYGISKKPWTNVRESPESSPPRLEDFEKMWHRTVERYTRRNLTIPTDRILAISGVARKAAKLTCEDDVYVAGHWMSMISRDLLWFTVPSDISIYSLPGCDEQKSSIPAYLGPSWAWTSVETEVQFSMVLMEDQVKQQYEKITMQNLVWKILDIRATLVDGNARFGAVHEAILILSAPIQQVHVEGPHPQYVSRFQPRPEKQPGIDLGSNVDYLDLLWDRQAESRGSDSVYLVVSSRANARCDVRGLIVKAVDEESKGAVGRYVRCGVWQTTRYWPNEIEAEAEMQTVDQWIDGFEERVLEIE
jgi:hypothetical protein